MKYKEQDVCVNPVFISHRTYPGSKPYMLMSRQKGQNFAKHILVP